MSDQNNKNPDPPVRPVRANGPFSGPSGPAQKPQNFKATIRKLLSYLKPYRAQLIVVIVFAVASTAFTIVGPKLLGNATNKIVEGYSSGQLYDQFVQSLPPGTGIPAGTNGAEVLLKLPEDAGGLISDSQRETFSKIDFSAGRPGIDFNSIATIAYVLIGLYALSSVFIYMQGWIMTSVTQKTTYRLRQNLSIKINKLPLSYFDGITHGEVLSRITNDVDTVSQTLNQSLTQIITAFTLLIGILGMMLSISWQMTLLAVFIVPLSFVLIVLIVKKSQSYFVQQQTKLGEINGHIEEMFSGHQVMKVFNGEKSSINKFNTINQELHEGAWKSQFLSGLLQPIMTFIGNLSYVLVAILGGFLAVRGQISIGSIQAFIQYMNQFTQPITQLANASSVLQSTAASAERVFEFLDTEEESEESNLKENHVLVHGKVSFNNVNFSYNPKTPIIRSFSADVDSGMRIAIVGPTGAGKTTIVNLLMRFYEIDSGLITIDNVSTKEISRSTLRQMFGMVLQDTWLFNGTIRDNIAYGLNNATVAQIIHASKEAHAHHFISSLPDGYDTILNEEMSNISQGEQQLITIARAMLANPQMLILDEATSSVDTRTELLVQKAMDKLMENRTSFVIAHRLSTIRDADIILVMKNGNIVEQGDHAELLNKDGMYASMYNTQFETK